jgi:hypothetical protein
VQDRVGDRASDRANGGGHTDGDPRAVLRYLQRPDRYTTFLDEDDDLVAAGAGVPADLVDPGEDVDRLPGAARELTGVAARLAAALNAESERTAEDAHAAAGTAPADPDGPYDQESAARADGPVPQAPAGPDGLIDQETPAQPDGPFDQESPAASDAPFDQDEPAAKESSTGVADGSADGDTEGTHGDGDAEGDDDREDDREDDGGVTVEGDGEAQSDSEADSESDSPADSESDSLADSEADSPADGEADGAAEAQAEAQAKAPAGAEAAPGPPMAPPVPAPHHRLRHPVLRAPVTTLRTRGHEPDPGRTGLYLAHAADLTLSGGLETALAAAPAVCAIAEQYVLRRVGGSSAAAVTAACSAAAELGRTAPSPAPGEAGTVPPGYAGLAASIAWLAGEGSPKHSTAAGPARLIRPDATTRPLFRLIEAALRPRRPRRGGRTTALVSAATATLDRDARIVIGLLWFGALAGAAGVITAMARSPHVAGSVVAVAGIPIAVTFALAAAFGTALVAWHAVRVAVRTALDGDGFGLVSGSVGPDPANDASDATGPRSSEDDDLADGPGLFDWVADRLDDLAGVPPVTGGAQRYALPCGVLWLGRMGGGATADIRTLRRAATDHRRRVVDLLLVTADLSSGRPRLLPFGVTERPEQEPVDVGFAFCRTCLVGLLPARVVDQMVLMSPGSAIGATGATCPRHAGQPLHDLPDPWDLPVAFAVRLAAATPVLLRPVPLYSLRNAGADRAGAGPEPGAGDVRTHWFGDGAVTGGLPNRVFDVPLPRWPTFTLATLPASGIGGDVDVPDQEAGPRPEHWRPVTGTAGLAAALLGAAAGWRDALHAEAPGRRGRFAAVRGTGVPLPQLGEEEIGRLVVRGYRAGRVLRERFSGLDVPLREGADGTESGAVHTGTDRFRWIRMRAALTEYRQLSLAVGASIPLYTDLALAYRVPAELSGWFSPPLTAGHADPAWGDAVAAVTHLKSLTDGGVLDWDTDWGAPPSDPHERLA